MTAGPKTVTINLRAIADDAGMIQGATDRLDEIVAWLQDLGDPRCVVPDVPMLREQAREFAGDLERASEEIWGAAEEIVTDIRAALDERDDDDDDDEGGAA